MSDYQYQRCGRKARCEVEAETWQARIAELEVENRQLRYALIDFVSLGESVGWDSETEYRETLMRAGRAALEGKP